MYLYIIAHTLINYNFNILCLLLITIAVAITMLKLDYPYFNTQTLELRYYINIAIATIPPNHWVRLAIRELFVDAEDAFIYI
jgi:hypothetical protein